jgi:surfeit locus 1 family protein
MMSLNMADSAKVNADYARAGIAPATAAVRPESRRRFRPRLLMTLLSMALIALFISFGQWQWNKATVKGDLQTLLDTRSAEPAISMPVVPANAQAMRYRQVITRGHYEAEHQILLDNRVHREQAGYHVITPLRIENSEMRVLVNRGWLPALAEHSHTPEVATPAGLVEVSGMAIVPGTRYFTLGAEVAGGTSGWQKVWQNLDLPRYGKAVNFPVQPVIIQLSPESTAGGFAREWPRPDERIERHVGYALQWWGFALATVLIWLVVNFRRED